MKIALILNEPYPFGMACTNRTHLYAKGFVELGNIVRIIIPRPTEIPNKVKNNEVDGKFEGVEFKYACKSTIRSNNYILRRYFDLISIINSFFLLVHFKPDTILVVSKHLRYVLLGIVCSSFTKAKLVREKSEIPFNNSEQISRIKRIRIKTEFKLANGLLVISEALKDFFLKDLSLKSKILVVPILVNHAEKTLPISDLTKIKPNLVCTGSLSNNKDGILIIIKAFAKILQKHPDMRLVMTGDINNSADKEKILELVDKLKLKEKVKLVGYVSKEKLQEITSTATALIAAKPKNRQNCYNMATKIGEYLLTSRPVIVSTIEPACRYLSHRINAFIVKPDKNQIIQEVEFILENPKEAADIGFKGRKFAIEFFDYKFHALRIINFFREL